MKRRQALANGGDLPGGDASGVGQGGQRGALVVTAHLDHVVDRRGIALLGELEPVAAIHDGPHVHVDVRGQARVQRTSSRHIARRRAGVP